MKYSNKSRQNYDKKGTKGYYNKTKSNCECPVSTANKPKHRVGLKAVQHPSTFNGDKDVPVCLTLD